MNVTVRKDRQYIKSLMLEVSPVEAITIMTALKKLHEDGGRNEIDRIASKELRKQIMSALEGENGNELLCSKS